HYYEDATRGTRDHDIAPLAGTGIEMRFDTKRPIDLRKTFIEAAAYTYIEAIAERLSDGESVLIAHESSGFGSRVPAQRVRRKLLSILPDMEGPLTLDFAGVHSVASSYIDELLGKLIAELGVDNFEDQIRVVNMAPAVMRRANVTIGQRLKTMGQERQVVGTGIDWDNVRPEPELELEAWLAVHPEDLEKEARAVIEGFAYRWEIELDDEVYRVMLAVFERVRDEEGEDPATG
ncbi:MAG: STAS-like domain-containing protein, partial [Bradymonadaceae bacterium]